MKLKEQFLNLKQFNCEEKTFFKIYLKLYLINYSITGKSALFKITNCTVNIVLKEVRLVIAHKCLPF